MLKLLLALVILWSMYVEQKHNFIYFFKFFAPRICGFNAVLDFLFLGHCFKCTRKWTGSFGGAARRRCDDGATAQRGVLAVARLDGVVRAAGAARRQWRGPVAM